MTEEIQDIELFWRSTIPEEVWSRDMGATIPLRAGHHGGASAGLPRLDGGDFDQFELHGVLGRGGMGVVHHATQGGLRRKVAYKRLYDDTSPEKAQILLQEALVTGALDHPSIVPVHVLGLEQDGRPAFVMKQVDGVEWKQVIEYPEGHEELFEDLEPHEFHVRVLMRICSAVHFAHERGVMHRDIKPENVLLGRYGEVYLMDWGLAAALDDRMLDRVPLARECRDVLGTPVYMAPEMARPMDGTIGICSDVYLLGASLYHALVGRPPHAAENLGLVLRSTQSSVGPTFPSSVARELVDICSQALAPRPEDRHNSADELRRDLARYLTQRTALQLAQRAQNGLQELLLWEDAGLVSGDTTETSQIIRGFAEVRFGFEQSLETWKDNTAARGGLAEVLAFGVRSHVRHGDLAAAENLISQIDEPERVLLRSVDNLRSRVQEQEQEREKMAALVANFDPRIGAGSRAMASLVVPFAWAGLLLGLYIMQINGTPLTWELWLGQAIASIVICLPVTIIGRRAFLGTLLNRRLSAGLYIGLVGDLMIRLACVRLEAVAPLDSVPIVMGAHGIALGMLGLQIDPRMVPSALLYFAGVAVSTYLPEQGLLI
ncbi:MAG: serine/threonine-protein kinase, partial [Myxococcota bacterium]|nr:serine/threonine-protein kinase [Myxococcota bacterium]